jgi:histidine triad (HIT) family protein
VTDCLFCRIVDGEIPADVVFSNDDVLAFRDIDPQAPQHVLVIPTLHAATLGDLVREEPQAAAAWLAAIPLVAGELGLTASGYRTVVNTGGDGGQTVDHVHAHVLGGRALTWPPG